MYSSPKVKTQKNGRVRAAKEGNKGVATATEEPQSMRSFSSVRAEALLSLIRSATATVEDGANTTLLSPHTDTSAQAATTPTPGDQTMYTTLGRFSPTGTGSADVNTAQVSAQLVAQVQIVAEQVSGAHGSAPRRVRCVRLTQELLSGCAALGLTPSMVMAGVPTILEQFARMTIDETPRVHASSLLAADGTTAPAKTPMTRVAAVGLASRDDLVSGERLLPPLVDQVQLVTQDGVDALAMDTYVASMASPISATATVGVNKASEKGKCTSATDATAPTSAPTSLSSAPACMRPDASAADVLLALLDLCRKPLTYLTLDDQQCLPAAVEALALSCSLIASRLDLSVILLDQRARQNVPPTAALHSAEMTTRARVLRQVRLAALGALESLLRPFAEAVRPAGASTHPQTHQPGQRSKNKSTAAGAVPSGRRRDRPASTGSKPTMAREKTASISRAIASTTSATIKTPSGAPSSTSAQPVYEPTVVAATLAAMDAQDFITALSGPLLERWATILQEAAVLSERTAEVEAVNNDSSGTCSGAGGTPLPSSQTNAHLRDPEDADGGVERELLVVSFIERLRLDSAHTMQQALPERDFLTSSVAPKSEATRANRGGGHPNAHRHGSGSSSEDEDDGAAAKRVPLSPTSTESSTAAAHQRLVLSRREEEEIGRLLRVFDHILAILEQRAARDEAWLKLTAKPSAAWATPTPSSASSAMADALHPLLPVLAVRTLSWALPGDYCASLSMDLVCWMLQHAPSVVSRALLYHVTDAAFFRDFERHRRFDLAENDVGHQYSHGHSDRPNNSTNWEDAEGGQNGEEGVSILSVQPHPLLDASAVPEPCALESLFDALVVQLNASHRLQQRELRNDLITLVTSVLTEDASGVRAIGQLRRASAKTTAATSSCVAMNTAQTQRGDAASADARHSPRAPRPLPPRAVDAVNAIVLTMFNLLCTPELNLVVAGLTDHTTGDGAVAGGRAAVNTSASMLAKLAVQLPLLSAQTLTHYTFRFNGIASPSQRRELFQFKRLGWQLLASFCEWQSARVYYEGSRYVPRALVSPEAGARGQDYTTYEGLYLVDLCLLGFLDVLLLYVDVECHIAAVVAWTQEELVTLQDDVWQLMSSLVENAEELRQLFALDWEVFTTTLATTPSTAQPEQQAALPYTHARTGEKAADGESGDDRAALERAEMLSGSLRSGSIVSAAALVGAALGNQMPDDHDLAAALKASSRFSSAPPPRRTSARLAEATAAQIAQAAQTAADAADLARVVEEDAKGVDQVEREAALRQSAALATPSVLKGPDVHLLEAGAVDIALRYVRVAPVRVEALKHKAVHLLDAIARSSSTTGATSSPSRPSAALTGMGEETRGLHLSMNARLSVQKYSPTLVRALLARTPGLVRLLVHILKELQCSTAVGIGSTHAVSGIDDVEEDVTSALTKDPLTTWQSPASPNTPFSLRFLQSASSSLLALVCVHFLHCLGESAKEEVGGIRELDALHRRITSDTELHDMDEDPNRGEPERHAARVKQAKRVRAESFLKNAADMTTVDMGYDNGEQSDNLIDVLDDEEEREDEAEHNAGARRSGASPLGGLKPMADDPVMNLGAARAHHHLDTSYRDVMKLGFEFEDAGGIELIVAWMKHVLLPNPTEAIAVGTHLEWTGIATATQTALRTAAAADATYLVNGGSLNGATTSPRAPPLQESHLFTHLDLLVALFGAVRSLILGSEHTESVFVKAGGVAVLLEVAEALAVASHALLPIPAFDDDAARATLTTKTHSDSSPLAPLAPASQYTDPEEASPAALARLKAALALVMVHDPAPLAAAARGDRHILRDRQAAFTDALRYALTLLSELLYTGDQACYELLRWRSRRIEKHAISTGGALVVKTTHDVFMNAIQLLIALWSAALARERHAAGVTSSSSSSSSAGLEVIRLCVREPACALLREEYVRRFLRAKLVQMFPEDATDVLRCDARCADMITSVEAEQEVKAMMWMAAAAVDHAGAAGVLPVEGSRLEATAALLSALDMTELFRYYLYATGQDASAEDECGNAPSDSANHERYESQDEDADADEEAEEGAAKEAAAVPLGAVIRVHDLRRRARRRGFSGLTVEDLLSVLRRHEKVHVLYAMAARVAMSDAGSEARRQRQLGQLIHNAFGLGEKVYSCLASLGFEHLISQGPSKSAAASLSPPGWPGHRGLHALENSALQRSTNGSGVGAISAELVSLSPSERSHLISIAALPALCMDEVCVAMANVAAVFYDDVALTTVRSSAGTGMQPSTTGPTSASSSLSPSAAEDQKDARHPADSSGQAISVRMRPTSPDRRCLHGVLTDVYARGHEISQLVHLGHEASDTQEQQLYDRFLVTRLKQPVTVLRGNKQTLLAMRDATYGARDDASRHGGPHRGSLSSRRRSSSFLPDGPHVIVPLSPCAPQGTSLHVPQTASSMATADAGMSALAARLAARMAQTQRQQEAQQLLQSLSSAPATAAAAAAVTRGHTSPNASGSSPLGQQLVFQASTCSDSGVGTNGVGVVIPRAPAQPAPPRTRALVQQRRKKEEMVRSSLKRLPRQKDEKPQDASTMLVAAVLKDVKHSS